MSSSRREFLRRATGSAFGVGAAATVGVQGARFLGGTPGQQPDSDPQALVAGSLLVVANRVSGATVEAHGSLTARNLVVDGARDPDVLALADPLLFEGLTDTATLFATNALVLAYHPDSAHADAIEAEWTGALARDDLRLGRTDPKADPLGYRTVLAMKLATDRRSVAPGLLDDSFVFPETALVRTLESGKLDAAFVYRNMAVEHDLPFVDLPASIDFSDPARADTYASVSLDLPNGLVRGAPIRYGATALTEAGEPWFESLVSDADLLREHGFTVPDEYPRKRV